MDEARIGLEMQLPWEKDEDQLQAWALAKHSGQQLAQGTAVTLRLGEGQKKVQVPSGARLPKTIGVPQAGQCAWGGQQSEVPVPGRPFPSLSADSTADHLAAS